MVEEVVVRPEQAEDRGAISEVHERAFGGPLEGQLVEALRSSPAFLPRLSLVALVADQLVGHILFSRIAVVGAASPGAAVALAPMAVDPPFQRRGIGSALVRAGLAACRRGGEALVVVVGHPAYYPRFGFRPAEELGVLPPFDVPREAWLALALRDRHPTGTVRYPPEFDLVS
jgi:predicted N-acetyltransferase YhbS